MEGIPKKKISRRVLAAIAIVIVIVVILAAWILTSSMSPSASTHDADGDGHPDASDAAPNDPLIWASGSATISATVNSHSTNSIHYTLSLNGVEKAEGDLAAGSYVTHSMTVNFLYGVSNYTTVTVLATSTGGEVGATSDQIDMNVVNGQTYAVGLDI